MIEKAQQLPADHVFLDLEDSVAPGAKAHARDDVVSALRDGDWSGKTRAVRINDVTTPWAFRDVIALVEAAGDRVDCIIIPKVQQADQVHFVDLLITQIEAEQGLEPGRIGIEIQIENAAGLINAESILAASDRIEAFVFGPGDLAADLGMPALTLGGMQPDYPGDHWHWVLYTILVHARNAGVAAIDGPYAEIGDLEGFRRLAARSRTLGFDGKWVLHPDQIEAANDVYGVDQQDFDRAADILDAYAEATQSELRGAVMFGREMIDEASRKMAEANLRKGRAQGLAVRTTPERVAYHERARWRRDNL